MPQKERVTHTHFLPQVVSNKDHSPLQQERGKDPNHVRDTETLKQAFKVNMFESGIQWTAEFHHLRGKHRVRVLEEKALAQSQAGQGQPVERRAGGSSRMEPAAWAVGTGHCGGLPSSSSLKSRESLVWQMIQPEARFSNSLPLDFGTLPSD